MDLYTINTDYINYLKKFQARIWDNEENNRLRPYAGVVMDIGNHKYYAPLSSPKPKHKQMSDRLDFIRLEYRGQLKAVINLNNMIPVENSYITKIDIENLSDEYYKNLLKVEMIDIRRKQVIIIKNAKNIYLKVTKYREEERNKKLVSLCYDFKLLEQKMQDYIL